MSDESNLIFIVLAAFVGIGFVVWLMSEQNKEQKKKTSVFINTPPKDPEKQRQLDEKKAQAKKRAAQRRKDALEAKAAADRKLKEQSDEKYQRWDIEKRNRLSEALNKHRAILLNNMSNSVIVNEYGHVEADERLEEWNRFLKSIGFAKGSTVGDTFKPMDKVFARKPKNYDKLSDPAYKKKNALTWEIEAHFAKEILQHYEAYKSPNKAAAFDPDEHPIDGHQFETWVASHLNNFGWQTKVTTGSGDQGVDIIGTVSDLTVGIQCKRYKKPVGNKAVQEIAAGIKHYNLDYAMVISTGGFTKSARELATSTEVLLVSHRDLPNLAKLITD